MADVTLSSAVRNNLLSLQNTAAQMEQTQNNLSTGMRVNSALDDPTAFFTASSLNSRAGDLSRLLDSIGLGIQTLTGADDGISSITNLVESAQATARQALQSPEAAAVAAEVVGTTNGLAGGDTLDDGALGIADTETLTIDDGTNNYTYTVADATSETVQNVIDDINADVDLAVTASLSADGELVLTADDNTITMTIGGTGVEAGFGLAAGAAAPQPGVNADRTSLEDQFNTLLTQINELAADAGFNGVNLLQGDDLEVTFNEDGSSSLTIEGVSFDAAGLGIGTLTTDDWQANGGINTTLDELDAAISTLRTQASTFGSNLSIVETREDFTNNLVNTLETGAAGLTLADTNEEGANMLALQTRQQLSSVALSLASQADQNVLRLF